MDDQILNLEAIHVISDPYAVVILNSIVTKKRVSFNELKNITKLSNDGVTKQLEKLQKYSLVKGELADPKNGSYAFFHLTKLGEEFFNALHDMLIKTNEIQPEPISDKFVIDFEGFEKILNHKKLEGLRKIFDHSKIVMTNSTYASAKNMVDENSDTNLEKFLENEDQVIISTAYKDVESSGKLEYYLKRIKKLLPNEARLVATAIDSQASLITDNEKISTAARSLGIISASVDAVMELKKGDYLWRSFFELSLKKLDSRKMNVPLENISLTPLKKN